ncbi:hypothetical protein ACGFYY_15460 [Streptomyces sp. NPDC048331]|uniref:hypothetical protein n=1 Tax=Streptomyces sp. NPDC048331 TaxID=3365534 RepID=UPI003721E770
MSGSFQQITLDGGLQADLFLLRYDEDGRLLSPRAEEELKQRLPGVTDVYLFSHGWNNVFDQALERYRSFVNGYMEQRRAFAIPTPQGYRPLLIGIIWPSTSFVFPWEAGPEIAAAPDPEGREAAEVQEMLELVAKSLPGAKRPELTERIDGHTAIDRDDALNLAGLLLGTLRAQVDPDDGSRAPTAEEFLNTLQASAAGGHPVPTDTDRIGLVPDEGNEDGAPPVGGAPDVAGGLSFDPRILLRTATVWKMKARAGDIGAHGVSPLVGHILQQGGPRLHLIGHSFGARVLLSALATAAPAHKAHSMLLLQPAVNRWCFAGNVAGTGRKGGYHAVPDLLERPLLTTLSEHDEPLRTFFHLAMRGSSQLGEPDIAAFGNTDLYGALGGYGPAEEAGRTAEADAIFPDKGRYDLQSGARIIAVDGSVEFEGKPAIPGHGEVSSPVTWWALHCLTRPD